LVIATAKLLNSSALTRYGRSPGTGGFQGQSPQRLRPGRRCSPGTGGFQGQSPQRLRPGRRRSPGTGGFQTRPDQFPKPLPFRPPNRHD